MHWIFRIFQQLKLGLVFNTSELKISWSTIMKYWNHHKKWAVIIGNLRNYVVPFFFQDFITFFVIDILKRKEKYSRTYFADRVWLSCPSLSRLCLLDFWSFSFVLVKSLCVDLWFYSQVFLTHLQPHFVTDMFLRVRRIVEPSE